LIHSPADIFKLEEAQLRARKKKGDVWARKLVGAIHDKRFPPLDRFIYALGIPHVGDVTARDLARLYGSWRQFESMLNELVAMRTAVTALLSSDTKARSELARSLASIIDVPGIGPEVALSIADFFAEPHNVQVVHDLLREVKPTDYKVQIVQSPVAGMTIVFTGALETMSREEAKTQAERLGAKAATSVSSKTNLVVAGPGAGSNLNKAQKLGVKVITEVEWQTLVEE
jgi:DNA ligase (NAD+)